MITKITGEAAFQVLTNNFSISPSQEGYTLQISADGKQYSNLFSVGAGVTRLVTGVAANSYYRLLGNQSQVSINWMKTCVTDGGADSTELTPIDYFPLDAEEGIVVAYNGPASATGVYQYDGSEWIPVGVDDLSAYWTSAQTKDYVDAAVSGIDLSNYYTKAETDSAITAVEDHIYDVEKVAASALTELHADILEISANTQDLSAYWTSAETKTYVDSAITEVQDQIDTMDDVVSAALVDLNDRVDTKVESSSVSTIWKGTTAEYDAIVTKDPTTLYIIVNNS